MLDIKWHAGALVVAIIALASLPLSFLHAAEDMTYVGGKPANPDPNNPRSKSIFIHTIDRNGTKNDALVVANDTANPRTIQLFATDAALTNTGSFSCKQNTEAKTEVGAWTTLATQEITVAPNSQAVVDFTVQVPMTASVGEHNGCIIIQDKTAEPKKKENVNLHFRSAIRMAITVPGEVFKQLSFADFWANTKFNKHEYNLALENVGNVSIDTRVTVTLHGVFGGNAYQEEGTYPVLPNSKLNLRFENDKMPFWGGWYWADATAGYNNNPYVFGADEQQAGYRTINSPRFLLFIWPHVQASLIMGLIVAIIAGLIVLGLYRYNRIKTLNRYWQPYMVKKGDTLQSIATHHAISWRLLARMNRLRAPYSITEGQTLHVPKDSST